MDLEIAKDLLVTWLIPAIGTFIADQVRRIAKTFKTMAKSIDQLNKSMKVVVERVDSHEGRLSKLEGEQFNEISN